MRYTMSRLFTALRWRRVDFVALHFTAFSCALLRLVMLSGAAFRGVAQRYFTALRLHFTALRCASWSCAELFFTAFCYAALYLTPFDLHHLNP
jgi:hypothetical protein